jgi:hypothetical protein
MRLPLRAQLPAPRSETDLQIDRFLDAMRGESTFEHNYPALLGFFASFRRVGVKTNFWILLDRSCVLGLSDLVSMVKGTVK